MKVHIRDKEALLAVSPAALSALRPRRWLEKNRSLRRSLRTYIRQPACQRLSCPERNASATTPTSYRASIETFAAVAEMDELALYRDLVTADPRCDPGCEPPRVTAQVLCQ